MKQLLQHLGTGETSSVEVPSPILSRGSIRVRTEASLVSLGTERMLVGFGRAGWLQKAKQQPEKVQQVLEKVKTDGLLTTLDAVKAKLDRPIPLGYSNCGTVLEVGRCVQHFEVGDRIVSNGHHAEVVVVPANLCAKVPPGVEPAHASFAVVGSIGLQGIRLLSPTLGETVVVMGLGLIGNLSAQMLQANGCRVIGIDLDKAKCDLAASLGITAIHVNGAADPLEAVIGRNGGKAVDAVLITASTSSSEPIHQAAGMCRKKGRIVLVGSVGMELKRSDFYEKELSFQVSCSYGPGRYDPEYEENGHDYPLGYVRWTAQRNFEAFLGLLASQSVRVGPMISHRFNFEDAEKAYDLVAKGGGIGILLEYQNGKPVSVPDLTRRTVTLPIPPPPRVPSVVVGLVGAGNFTGQVLLPALAATGARLRTIVSASGLNGTHLGRKFGFELSTTDGPGMMADPEINLVLITTRHGDHARQVIKGLRAAKRVYVEKPLCLTLEELKAVEQTYQDAANPFLMVGFNRRFAPQTRSLKRLLDASSSPKALIFTANAGAVPSDHWTQNPEAGGGRIIGEACHFIDLLRYLAGAPIVSATPEFPEGTSADKRETCSISLRFADGSIGTVHYLANGSKSFPKERLEVFCGGGILQLDNFRVLRGYGWPKFKKQKLWRQDKGHRAEMQALVDAVKNGKGSPIPFDELVEVAAVAIRVANGETYCRKTKSGEPKSSIAPESELTHMGSRRQTTNGHE